MSEAGDGPERSAGGVVMRRDAEGRLHVLVAQQRDRLTGVQGWRLPKGHLERGESAEQAALREVAEEVGVQARILAPLPDVDYRYFDPRQRVHVAKRVHFFAMAVVSGEAQPRDGEMQRVAWLPLDAALAALRFGTERAVVSRAAALLESAHSQRP